MGSIHKDLLICVLYNDTANSSECLMSNVWLMGEEFMGEGNIMVVLFRLAKTRMSRVRFPNILLEFFMYVVLAAELWP